MSRPCATVDRARTARRRDGCVPSPSPRAYRPRSARCGRRARAAWRASTAPDATRAAWAASAPEIFAARARHAGTGPLIGYAGRLVYEKGVQHLVGAVPKLRRRFPGLRVVVVGDGPYREDLIEQARRQRVSGSVTFTGFLAGGELPALLGAVDAAVVPSLYEPFGMVALEAAAAGAPLAVSRTGGLTEIVEAGVTGVTFPSHEAEGLASAVGSLLENEIRSAFGDRGAPSRAYVDVADADRFASRFEARFLDRGGRAQTIRSIVHDELSSEQQFFALIRGYLALGLIVGVAGIGVIMVRAVRERRRQVGVLRALGVQAQAVRSAFVVESAFVAAEGLVIGTLLALVTAWSITLTDAFGSGLGSGSAEFPPESIRTTRSCGVVGGISRRAGWPRVKSSPSPHR